MGPPGPAVLHGQRVQPRGSAERCGLDRHLRPGRAPTTCAPASWPRRTPALNGGFNDKTAIEVDRGVNSPLPGQRVRRAEPSSRANGNNEIKFVRSTDHGATFSNPTRISEGSKDDQFADIAVTSNGTVYVVWRGFGRQPGQRSRRDAVREVHRRRQDASPSRASPPTSTASTPPTPPATPRRPQEAHEQAFEHADGPESEAGEELGRRLPRLRFRPVRLPERVRVLPPRQPAAHHRRPQGRPEPAVDGLRRLGALAPRSPSTSTYNTAPVAADGTLRVAPGGDLLHVDRQRRRPGRRRPGWPRRPSVTSSSPTSTPTAEAVRGLARQPQRPRATASRTRPATRRAKDAAGFHLPTDGTGHLRRLLERRRRHLVAGPTVRRAARCRTTRCSATGGCRSTATTTTCRASDAFAYGTWTDTRQVRPGDDPRYDGGEGFDVCQCRTQAPTAPGAPTPAPTPVASTRTSTAPR